MTKKTFSSGIIFLGYKSNFHKSGGGGGAHASQPPTVPMALFMNELVCH